MGNGVIQCENFIGTTRQSNDIPLLTEVAEITKLGGNAVL